MGFLTGAPAEKPWTATAPAFTTGAPPETGWRTGTPNAPDMAVFHRHVDDAHLDPHPQYALRGDLRSAAAPSDPVRGDTWVDTDTMEQWLYYGATTGWQRPWFQSWGLVDYAERTTDIGGVSGHDLASLTLTVTPVVNRWYRIRHHSRVHTPSAALTCFAHIRSATSTDHQVVGLSIPASGQGYFDFCYEYLASSASSITWKLYMSTSTGSVTLGANSTYPAFISVEDIGGEPGTAPSA
jgi:hypothetical protein